MSYVTRKRFGRAVIVAAGLYLTWTGTSGEDAFNSVFPGRDLQPNDWVAWGIRILGLAVIIAALWQPLSDALRTSFRQEATTSSSPAPIGRDLSFDVTLHDNLLRLGIHNPDLTEIPANSVINVAVPRSIRVFQPSNENGAPIRKGNIIQESDDSMGEIWLWTYRTSVAQPGRVKALHHFQIEGDPGDYPISVRVTSPVLPDGHARTDLSITIVGEEPEAPKTEPGRFPDIGLELTKFSWREEGKNYVVSFPLNVTNRHDKPVNLQFELGFEREHLHRIQWVQRLAQEGMPMAVLQHNVLPPLHVEPGHTERFELHFWIGEVLIRHLLTESKMFDRTYKNLHYSDFRLRLTDYVSGTSQVRELGTGAVPTPEAPE